MTGSRDSAAPSAASLVESLVGPDEAARAVLRVTIVNKLLLEMESRGIAKRDLAEALGIRATALERAFTITMTLDRLSDICTVLGLEPKFDLIPKSKPLSAIEAELLRYKPEFIQHDRSLFYYEDPSFPIENVRGRGLTRQAAYRHWRLLVAACKQSG